MTQHDVKRLALVLAVQAEIEGMKVENSMRIVNGLSEAYGADMFDSKAAELRTLAYAHDEQL
jgi:hypothetical protein